MRILIVEDEEALREGLVDLMVGDGHTATAVADGAAAVELGLREPFDVVLLDRVLHLLLDDDERRRLRAARPGLSILMLTARGSEDDKVTGLGEGADDYVTKPFAARELLARVRVLGRRHLAAEDDERIAVGHLELDLGQLSGTAAGKAIRLSPREAGIIRLLRSRAPKAVSRSELLEVVWGSRGDLETRAVDMAIATLRKKIEENPRAPALLRTLKGVGYVWGEAS